MPGNSNIPTCPYRIDGSNRKSKFCSECNLIYYNGTQGPYSQQEQLRRYHRKRVIKLKALSQLADEKIVSRIMTHQSDYWIKVWSDDRPNQQLKTKVLQIEREINKAINFLQDPTILPRCFPKIKGIQKCLQDMAEDCKNIRRDTLSKREHSGLAADPHF